MLSDLSDRLRQQKWKARVALRDGEIVAVFPESKRLFGLAVDIGVDTYDYTWLKVNSWRYGFIQRYPEGGEEITGYAYEPWHFRYVGVPVASFMHVNNIQTLEDFVDTYIGQ